MIFVRERGIAMARAAATTPTGMSAVLGGNPDDVVAAARAVGLSPANMNGAGQIVVAGTLAQVDTFSEAPPAGTRVRPLEVVGAFHTEHMAPAVAHLERLSHAISTHDPRLRLISNTDGQVVHDGREVLRRLVSQVSTPVRWDLCMQTMADLGVTALIEIPPAGTLTGLAKRALPGVETLAVKTPDDLDAAWRLIRDHGTVSPLDGKPTWRLIVSPAKGTFTRVTDAMTGFEFTPGSVVGTVANLRESLEVQAPHGGHLVEWLADDGDPVNPGQPLLRLHPISGDAHV
jgi:[acyl-carrier-protein] S-malonyltransferase